MDKKNVPAELHDFIEVLTKGSYNVESYVVEINLGAVATEAIDQAENWGVAKGDIVARMVTIIKGADEVLQELCGKRSEIDMSHGGEVNVTLQKNEIATILAALREVKKNHNRASLVMAHKDIFMNAMPLENDRAVDTLFTKLWNRGKKWLKGDDE